MNAKDVNVLLRNNTGNKTKSNLVDGFVIRTKQFKNILSEIKLSKTDKPEQNYLIIGQRGAGKTFLLYRLKYAIEDDQELKTEIIPIMFSEEQYNLMEVADLWESIGEHLEAYIGFESLLNDMQAIGTDNFQREEQIYELLENKLKENRKKAIVFIENVDVFFKKISREGQQRLREVLTTSNRFRLICSSTTFFDGIVDYSDPFYDFFKIIQLNGLTRSESEKLIKKLAEQWGEGEQVEQILKEHPKRLESLRRLTGGNPRIISYLFQIFLDNENGKAIVDLYQLLDTIGTLYKAELDLLSAQKQKIIDVMARNWDAIATKDISSRTKIDSKNVSSILKSLEKDQVVESINTKTKNNLYRIKDRFLNIWYLMRFGKKREKENVIWLVRFYDAWCDRSEMSKRINSLISELENEQYDTEAALYMGNVFLSCKNVSPEVKYNLYKKAKSILPNQLITEMSDDSLYESIRALVEKRDFDGAFEALAEIQSNEKKLAIESWLYLEQGDYQKANDSLEVLYQAEPDGELAFRIASLYELMPSKTEKALEFFNLALEQEVWKAANNIGQIYYYDLDDLSQAEKYINIAIERGLKSAIMDLAKIYFDENMFSKSEELLLKNISQGEKGFKNNLALIYQEQDQIEKAIATYKEAIAEGETTALLNLGQLYTSDNQFNPEEAKKLFEKAIELDNNHAYTLLGRLYVKLENEEEAKRVLLNGTEKGDAMAAHVLAHLYEDEGDWDNSEEYFLKSVELGKISSLMCLFEGAFKANLNDRKGKILDEFEKYIERLDKEIVFMMGYARLLVWNDEIGKSISTIETLQERFNEIFYGDNKTGEIEPQIIQELIEYFVLLIAKGQFNAAYNLLNSTEFDFKQVLKPLYFALMHYMEKEYPNEFLKAGDELKETIEEIISNIEEFKKLYN